MSRNDRRIWCHAQTLLLPSADTLERQTGEAKVREIRICRRSGRFRSAFSSHIAQFPTIEELTQVSGGYGHVDDDDDDIVVNGDGDGDYDEGNDGNDGDEDHGDDDDEGDGVNVADPPSRQYSLLPLCRR